MNFFTWLFVIGAASYVTLQFWLSQRHISFIGRHRDRVPAAFGDDIGLDDHQKAADYNISGTRLDGYELFYGAALLLLWTLGGGLEALDSGWRALGFSELNTGIAVIVSAFIIIGVLDLPFSIYRTFVHEQRFGFNRTTPRIFLSDYLKELVLMLLLGIPMIALVLWLMDGAGSLWWLYVWLAWLGFSLLMMWAYPTLIAPLFNKFLPLQDEGLRRRIESLLERSGFSSRGIFVMDGSTRSSHGNAYFTGFGSHKRIVFFDTLLNELNHQEIESVLAHELGHFKRKHVLKNIVVMAVTSLLGLALLGFLMEKPWFYQGLGVSTPSVHTALLLFILIAPVFTFFLQPLMAAISRKHEFEADDYAAAHADARHLISALVKMYKENASTLTPDPLFSAFHHSHPPAPIRVAHLESKQRAGS